MPNGVLRYTILVNSYPNKSELRSGLYAPSKRVHRSAVGTTQIDLRALGRSLVR